MPHGWSELVHAKFCPWIVEQVAHWGGATEFLYLLQLLEYPRQLMVKLDGIVKQVTVSEHGVAPGVTHEHAPLE